MENKSEKQIISYNTIFAWLNYILQHEGTTSGKYEKEQLIHPKHFFIDSFVSIHFHCLLKFLLFSPFVWVKFYISVSLFILTIGIETKYKEII
jgi:hypothetical protein